MNKRITLDDLNKLLTKARKTIEAYGLPLDSTDLTILIGRKEIEEIKFFTYSGQPPNENGLDILKRFCVGIIETNDDSRLEICWVLPS